MDFGKWDGGSGGSSRRQLLAEIEKAVRPHGLRHTFAAELCREGVPLNEIQQALGHSNAATTSRYLAHVAPEKLLATLRAREWPPAAASQ